MFKKIVYAGIAIAICFSIIGLGYSFGQKEYYESEDPLHGSFLITNGVLTEEIYPSDFLVSVNVSTDHDILTACAMEQNVDLSKGCWVYCFAENRIFEAKKDGNRLYVYDDAEVIGSFAYVDKIHTVNWRGDCFSIEKQMQAFIFP